MGLPMFKEQKSECPTTGKAMPRACLKGLERLEESYQTSQSLHNLEGTSASHRDAAIHSGAWTKDFCSFMLQDADEGLAIAMDATEMAHIVQGNIGGCQGTILHHMSARNMEQTALYLADQQDVAAFLDAWTENWDKMGTDESDGKLSDVEEKSNSTSSLSSRVSR